MLREIEDMFQWKANKKKKKKRFEPVKLNIEDALTQFERR